MRKQLLTAALVVLVNVLGGSYVYAATSNLQTAGIGLGAGMLGGALSQSVLGSLSGAGAMNGAITAADMQCVANKSYKKICNAPPTKEDPLVGGLNCPCTQSAGGGTQAGICIAPLKCRGTTFSGLGSGSGGGLMGGMGGMGSNMLMMTLGQMLGQMLMGGGGGSGGDSGSGSGTGTTGCTSQITVNDPALLTNNPCAVYVPPVGTTTPNPVTQCTISGQTYSSIFGCMCPDGQQVSITENRCVSASTAGTCTNPDQRFDTVVGRCVCTEGTVAIDNNSRCGIPTCQVSGQIFSGTHGQCECPVGKTISQDGNSCIEANPTTCASNDQLYSATHQRCECSTGKVLSPDGKTCNVAVNTNLQITGSYLVPVSPMGVSSTTAKIGYSQNNTAGYFDSNGNNGTLVVRSFDEKTNSQTAAFYGGTSGNNPVTALFGSWCSARPWSNNFLGKVFGVQFFDGLCGWAGLRVGPPAPIHTQVRPTTSTPRATTPVKKPIATSTPINSTTTVPARVQIWAVPTKVALGARTTVYWNTQGVTKCDISSPDGSFHQTTLAGGGSTVPLTGATTYTISCLDFAGNPVTDYTTVQMR